jgi:hypothetical protein
MWTRRVLLATLVAAAAMTLPRAMSTSSGSAFAANPAITVSALH